MRHHIVGAIGGLRSVTTVILNILLSKMMRS